MGGTRLNIAEAVDEVKRQARRKDIKMYFLSASPIDGRRSQYLAAERDEHVVLVRVSDHPRPRKKASKPRGRALTIRFDLPGGIEEGIERLDWKLIDPRTHGPLPAYFRKGSKKKFRGKGVISLDNHSNQREA